MSRQRGVGTSRPPMDECGRKGWRKGSKATCSFNKETSKRKEVVWKREWCCDGASGKRSNRKGGVGWGWCSTTSLLPRHRSCRGVSCPLRGHSSTSLHPRGPRDRPNPGGGGKCPPPERDRWAMSATCPPPGERQRACGEGPSTQHKAQYQLDDRVLTTCPYCPMVPRCSCWVTLNSKMREIYQGQEAEWTGRCTCWGERRVNDARCHSLPVEEASLLFYFRIVEGRSNTPGAIHFSPLTL